MSARREDLVDRVARTALCPRCEREQPLRDFATLGMSPLYAELLAPIYRCKLCEHLFAPRRRVPAVGAGPARAARRCERCRRPIPATRRRCARCRRRAPGEG